ncbi:MAG: uroporphyrinogen-III synthase, partial [Candidatus Caenarcaniphilales bacterium]|nr:uroporphyrinogen-III synthase [Candidatus Caenarcaniphilales bacterium]
MIESSFSNASFLLVCPEHKLQELKILFTNSFPQAYIYAIASIRLTKNFSKSLFSENTEIKKEIEEANWIVLSSSFAAQIFLEEIETEANLKEKLKQKKFASVGPSVSQLLERNGLVVALESPSLNIEGLNQAFESMLQEKEVANTKFLFITGNKTASGSLMNELEQKGANC